MSESKTSKELAFEGIKELVEKFENNYKQFHASEYNETLTRCGRLTFCCMSWTSLIQASRSRWR